MDSVALIREQNPWWIDPDYLPITIYQPRVLDIAL